MADARQGERQNKRPRSRVSSTESSTIEEIAKARALVRRADMLHRESSVSPEEPDVAATLSARHMATRKQQERLHLAPVKNYELVPRGITRERLLAYNAAAAQWLTYAAAGIAKPKESCVLLAIPLGWRYNKGDAGEMSIRLTNAIQGIYQCSGVTVTAPQESTVEKKGYPRYNSPPHAFMVMGMSPEDGKAATARYAHCARFDSGEVVAFTLVYWDIAPPIHVTTLVDVDGLGAQTDELESELLEHIVIHVTSRTKIVEEHLLANTEYFWGKREDASTGLDPDWLSMLLQSLRVKMLVDDAEPAKKRNRVVQLNVYAMGAFTDAWSREGWTKALLGDKVPLGRHGFATPIKKAHECSYCHDADHHRRLCHILRHPGWFHQPAMESEPAAASTGASTGGNGGGRGGNGGGRGGNSGKKRKRFD